MKLFLASEAKHPDSIEKLENYIGGLKGKKMYLLKNGEVIIVEDNNVKVLGEERIITNNS